MIKERDIVYNTARLQIANKQYLSAFQSLYRYNPYKEPVNVRALSHYGYCLAIAFNRYPDGIKICRNTLTMDHRDPELYWNLGQLYLASGNRDLALKVLYKGLKFEQVSKNPSRILNFIQNNVIRRTPFFSFLPRTHFLNIHIGKFTWARFQRINHAEDCFYSKRAQLSDYLFLPVYNFLFRLKINSNK